jgi:blocked-early-in-transport protein 1
MGEGGDGKRERERDEADEDDRGQYSDAVLNELESQNDGQVEGIMGKVRQLKDVSSVPSSDIPRSNLTLPTSTKLTH